jgi:hypothetical protein
LTGFLLSNCRLPRDFKLLRIVMHPGQGWWSLKWIVQPHPQIAIEEPLLPQQSGQIRQGARLPAERGHERARKIVHRPGAITTQRLVSNRAARNKCLVRRSDPAGACGPARARTIDRPYRAIAGEKISYWARKFFPTGLTTGSSTHRVQECMLAGDALCIVLRLIVSLHTEGAT